MINKSRDNDTQHLFWVRFGLLGSTGVIAFYADYTSAQLLCSVRLSLTISFHFFLVLVLVQCRKGLGLLRK